MDPDGRRTIGVITKLDIMDRGTNAVHYIRGDVVPLALGYIGVINRCQEDIQRKRSIRDALSAETSFFQSHPEYAQARAHTRTSLARAIAIATRGWETRPRGGRWRRAAARRRCRTR